MAAATFRVATADTTALSAYPAASFTPAIGDLIVVFVAASGTVAAGTCSSTGSGATTFSLVTSGTANGAADTNYCFISNTYVTDTDGHVVTFDCTGDPATGAIVACFTVSDVPRVGLDAIRQSAKQDTTAAGTPAPAFGAAALTGNPTLGMVGNGTNPAGMTPPTSWTESSGADVGYGTPATGLEAVFRNSGFTGTTVTWGSASASAFGSIIIELDLSATGYKTIANHNYVTVGNGMSTNDRV